MMCWEGRGRGKDNNLTVSTRLIWVVSFVSYATARLLLWPHVLLKMKFVACGNTIFVVWNMSMYLYLKYIFHWLWICRHVWACMCSLLINKFFNCCGLLDTCVSHVHFTLLCLWDLVESLDFNFSLWYLLRFLCSIVFHTPISSFLKNVKSSLVKIYHLSLSLGKINATSHVWGGGRIQRR
jgi:hypothetical protein